MIPLRVCLKGFMSYHNETVFTFDGASLWVLTGRNGSGKSAVFDAITFALFGIHRGDSRTAKPLINHKSSTLVVEFDFTVGANAYRVVRTVPRRGEATCLASHLQGPNAPYPNKKSPQPIPNTDNETGFSTWLNHVLGMNHKTFTASVLLRQGKSEEILNATPQQRHDILSELLDLSAYKRLEQRAKDKLSKYEGEAEALQRQLESIPSVEDPAIAVLDERLSTVSQEREGIYSQIRRLDELKVYAQSWITIEAKRHQIEQKLYDTVQLLGQEPQIKSDKARLDELNGVLVGLERLHQEQKRLSVCRDDSKRYQSACLKQSNELKIFEQKILESQNSIDELAAHQQDQQQIKHEATLALSTFEADYRKLLEISDLANQLNGMDKALQNFPEDLDDRVVRGQATIDELHKLNGILPYLDQFVQARTRWHNATQTIDERKRILADITSQYMAIETEWQESIQQRDTIQEIVQNLYQSVTDAHAYLKQVIAREKRFHEVEGKPQCHYCGQPLTFDHLEAERHRLNVDKEIAENILQDFQRQQHEKQAEFENCKQAVEALSNRERSLASQQEKIERDLQYAEREQKEAEINGKQVLSTLPDNYQQKISESSDVLVCFAAEYPSPSELQDLRTQLGQFPKLKKLLEQRLQQRDERNSLRGRCQVLINQLEVLERLYPLEKKQEIINARQSAESAKMEADKQLKSLEQPIHLAKKAFQEWSTHYNSIKSQFQQNQQRLAEVNARMSALEESIQVTTDGLPHSWQNVAQTLTETQLQIWQQETISLSYVEQRYTALIEARNQEYIYREQLSDVQKDLIKIPDEAKYAPSELSRQIDLLEQHKRHLDQTIYETQSSKTELEQRRTQREQLDKCRIEAAHKARLYKELSTMFGRDDLQRYLLQRVEAAVVYNANEVLDRISGGNLRLKLKEKVNNIGSAKALDIDAYNRQIGSEPTPVPVAYLSGSQRFRVAVSLALGIGRYASQGAKHIESVIIDEGFGGLDKEGRDQMIEELHELKNSLSKIILVSHQEEIADAFREHGYEIRLENGSSQVIRL